jgi:hypothetical protein
VWYSAQGLNKQHGCWMTGRSLQLRT